MDRASLKGSSMQFFKDQDGTVYAFEEGQEEFIPGHLQQITEAEANALRFPPPSKAEIWERIKAERDRRTHEGGYQAAVAGVSKWFHSDPFSRTQQLGLLQAGASVPAVQWKTMDGSFVTMSQAWAQAIFAAAVASDTALFAYAEQLRAQVEASADPESINILAGWPQVYGEA
jgi:ribosome modulation factor